MINYIKTNWIDSVTPVNAANLNNIENAIVNIAEVVNANHPEIIDKLKFNTEDTQVLEAIGEVSWDSKEGTLSVKVSDEVNINIGKNIYFQVKNTGVTNIPKGTLIYLADGQHSASLVDENTTSPSERILGITAEEIVSMSTGIAIITGELYDINTAEFLEGDILWVESSGAITNVKPDDRDIILLGMCTKSGEIDGSIYVNLKVISNLVDYGPQVMDLTTRLGILEAASESFLSNPVSKLTLDTVNPGTLTNVGDLTWNDASKTAELKITDHVSLSIGQEIYIQGKNTETTTILNGDPVYISGATGAIKEFKKVTSTNDLSDRTIGLAMQDISPNTNGLVTTFGEVHDLNTSAFDEGDRIWMNSAGLLTNVEPTANEYHIFIGFCTRSHASEGVIFVNIKVSYKAVVEESLRTSNINKNQILGFNEKIEIDFTLLDSYFDTSGNLGSNASFDSAIVDVEAGEDYYIYTRGNRFTSIVDIESIIPENEYSVNTILEGDISSWQLVKITALYDKIGISLSTAGTEHSAFVIKSKGSLLEAYENIGILKTTVQGIASNATNIASNATNIAQVQRSFFDNSGSVRITLPTFTSGYYNYNGTISAPFYHSNVAVESGKMYAILTRLTSTTSVVSLNAIDDISGEILFRGWSDVTTGWQLHFVKATTNFMGISNIGTYDTNDEVQLFKITKGWLYDLQELLLPSDGFVQKADTSGIIPSNFSLIGGYNVADGFITTQGICTNYGDYMREDGKLLKSLHFYTNGSGKIRFGIGTIDQRGWAIVQETFDISCVAGENIVDIAELGLTTIRKGYLFAYNNIDGQGISVGYKLRDVAGGTGYIYSNGTTGELLELDSQIAPNTAYLCLLYQITDDNLIYDLKKNSNEIDNWAQEAMLKDAMTRAYGNLVQGTDGLYKLNITGGVISASLLSFNKITIFGNSIWTHSPLANGSGWLEPYTDVSGDWTYTGEVDSEGMAGMYGRGMAATQQEFDFKHLFRTGIQVSNPSVVVQGAGIANTERNLPSVFPSTYDSLLTNDVDVVIWRCGENVGSIDLYENALRSYIVHFQTRCPNALVILTGRFWKNEPSDRIVSKLANEFRLPFIRQKMDGSKYKAEADDIHEYPVILDDGITTGIAYARIGAGAGHPSNLGMYEMANQLLIALAQKPLNLLHKVFVYDSYGVYFDCYDEQIEGALFSLRIKGSLPNNILVKDANGEPIIYDIRNKLDYGLICDYVVTFEMPKTDVTIVLS